MKESSTVGLTIPYDVADNITKITLIDHLNYLREEVRLHVEQGKYMHPEDYQSHTVKLIPALELVVDFFGGE